MIFIQNINVFKQQIVAYPSVDVEEAYSEFKSCM